MRSPSRLVPAAALVLAFALGFWVLRRTAVDQGRAVEVATAVVKPSQETPRVAASPSPSPRRLTIRTETEIAPSGIVPEIASIAAKTAEDYRRRARFPRSSQPIEDGADPIVRDREVTRGKSLGSEGNHPTLVVWPERTGFEAPNSIVLYAYLVDDERKVSPKEIHGEIRTQQGGVLASLDFRDDGSAGDSQNDDLLYTAVVAPGRERALEFKGAQLVEVRVETASGEERVATTGFLYSIPLAHLTGRYRDEIVDGNLVVNAEVEVHASARFHLEATLAYTDGTAMGWAQNALVLEAGTRWIPLTYWGLMFRERGADGPYLLVSVALSTTGEMPNQKNDVAWSPHLTKPYQATMFSDRSFADPDLLDAAARLEADRPVGGLEAGSDH